ncbi:SAM-dependent methyltransferase [Prauserella oleivorans]|uniref:S-adenosyl methyltransferase n=2 Tax=Prauserella TaxID=142577 RepID=A0A318M3J3_9PSEU|nr:SAM-dependent methyltransferase [Prauserella flavalba]PXY25563.1 hypothetical protein BA062_25760 [Prauserella flavalba]
MATQEDSPGLVEQVDPDAPSLSRIYDYLLGGGHNFAADRAVANKITTLVPGYDVFVRESRTFVRRAVLHMLTAGIEQFLDLGAGMFSTHPVHHLAQAERPDARVVYVDRDPVVIASIGLLVEQNDPRVGVVEADLRNVDEVLDNAVTTRRLDLSRPVAVVAGAVLHCLPDAEEAAAALTSYYERLAPGSLLAVSHADGKTLGPELAAAVEGCFAEAGITVVHRSQRQFAKLLGLWHPHPDGVVPVGWWRPDSLTLLRPEHVLGNAVLASRRHELAEQA